MESGFYDLLEAHLATTPVMESDKGFPLWEIKWRSRVCLGKKVADFL